jgi:hypothetical protein
MLLEHLIDNQKYRHQALQSRRRRQIGVSLKKLKESNMMIESVLTFENDIPKILRDCTKYLQGFLTVEGILRTAGSGLNFAESLTHINEGNPIQLTLNDEQVAVAIFKRFCADLPNTILPSSLLFENSLEIENIIHVLTKFDDLELKVFHHLFTFFQSVVEISDVNRMTPFAIGRSLGISLIHNISFIRFENQHHVGALADPKLGISGDAKAQSDAAAQAANVVAFTIEKYDEIIGEFCDARVQLLLNCKPKQRFQPDTLSIRSGIKTGIEDEAVKR